MKTILSLIEKIEDEDDQGKAQILQRPSHSLVFLMAIENKFREIFKTEEGWKYRLDGVRAREFNSIHPDNQTVFDEYTLDLYKSNYEHIVIFSSSSTKKFTSQANILGPNKFMVKVPWDEGNDKNPNKFFERMKLALLKAGYDI